MTLARELNDAAMLESEYASAERLDCRMRAYRQLADGPNPEDVVVSSVRRAVPRPSAAARVLEVGCGSGALAARLMAEGFELEAVDRSPAMAELAREHGVSATRADVARLPFPDGAFACVVAAWMLYHAEDLTAALEEIARVLAQGGTLVAATLSDRNMAELWEVLGVPVAPPLPFSSENGFGLLERRLTAVERTDVEGRVVFESPAELREYVGATIRRAAYVGRVTDSVVPVTTYSRHTIFTAVKP